MDHSARHQDDTSKSFSKIDLAFDQKVEHVSLRHKFAGGIQCDLSIGVGGAGEHHFFIINIKQHQLQQMMVADSRGRLVHVSKAVAEDLGHPMQKLLGDTGGGSVWDMIMHEPFNLVHRNHMTVSGTASSMMP